MSRISWLCQFQWNFLQSSSSHWYFKKCDLSYSLKKKTHTIAQTRDLSKSFKSSRSSTQMINCTLYSRPNHCTKISEQNEPILTAATRPHHKKAKGGTKWRKGNGSAPGNVKGQVIQTQQGCQRKLHAPGGPLAITSSWAVPNLRERFRQIYIGTSRQ